MSDHQPEDPFLAQASAAPQWQGTPIPSPPPMNAPPSGIVPPPPGYVPPPPGYVPPPPGYAYAASYQAANTSDNWMGIASLVLSLSTLVFGITCIPGVIFGHMGLSAANKGRANNKGVALAGVIIGWVFLGIGVLYGVFMVFLFTFLASAGG